MHRVGRALPSTTLGFRVAPQWRPRSPGFELRRTSTRSGSRSSRCFSLARGELLREPVEFINVGLIGLTNGAIYGVVALGYTLVYGILQLINFAHGDVFALSGSSRARSSCRCSGSTPTRACRSSSVGSSSRSS